MPIKKLLKKAAQQSKIVRYRAYKKVGVVRHRRQLDFSLMFLLLLILVSVSFFFIKPNQSVDSVSELNETEEVFNPDAIEVVHSDLGDEPVIEETGINITDLEKRVQAGESILTTLVLEKGENLFSLLAKENIPVSERINIADTLSVLIDLKTLQPGMSFILFYSNDGAFEGLTLPLKNEQVIAVIKDDDGSYVPVSQEGRIERQTERFQGIVERTFSGSAQKAGVPDYIVAQIADILNGEIDFSSDIHAGDSFDVIIEKKVTESGLEIGARQLLFVGLKTASHEIYRYAYVNKFGQPGFYDPKGKSGAKELYTRPVKGKTRLSSPYGRRRHPILLYEIFHHGVDLAAPKNTPIMAAADGVITQLGRKGAYGKYIRIKHEAGYQTAYGHMNGYRMDLKVGSKVKRGDVIGYIGSTGRSTGPHVHFEVWKNGKTVNPFGKNVIPSKQLEGFELEQFQFMAEGLHPDFKRQLIGKLPPFPGKKPDSLR